ncbi:MAG: tRNA-intron lyase [Desulfurococcales archaeon]|nr:tRNA-intron lyase [Desulfurococcales archaeon]
MAGAFRGTLLGFSVIVGDIGESRKLYSMGYYGKPIGVPKPRGADFNAPLKLSLLEALYLAEKGLLEIVDARGGKVGLEEIRRLLGEMKKFELLYKVYKDLRDRRLVARPGLKYGADFTVYRVGPGIDHAPYVVHVYDPDERIDPVEIVRAGRLSHSVRKTFVMATPTRDGKILYLMFKWFKP